MRHVLSILLGFLASIPCSHLQAAHTGPVPAPTDAFGAPGPYAVRVESFPSPGFAGKDVTVFAPAGVDVPRPTWFFCHGFGGYQVAFYAPLLRHVASHGWCAVFSPYAITGSSEEHYEDLHTGFVAAAERHPELIDTRRVGFAGHSFGGGAAPGLLLKSYRELGWGSEARCLMPMAPWYSHILTDEDLAAYPAGTQAIVQVYEDDVMNDHRMAIDVFRRLGIAAADKDFVTLRTDVLGDYVYQTGHDVPARGADDAIFERGVLRLIAALSASCFAGDPAGRAIALGGGSAAQCDMGEDATGRELRPMHVTDEPWPRFPQGRYQFPFAGHLNPRVASAPAEAPPAPAHLVNLSVRARSASGDRILIAGAALEGTGVKSLLIRAAGPGLAQFDVTGRVADPRLAVYRDGGFDVGNDQWEQAPNVDLLKLATSEAGAFEFDPASTDAAALFSFGPGPLTAHAVPASGEPGVTLVELYDADLDTSSRLVNLSGRAFVGGGEDLLIAGFVVQGPGTVRLLVRAIGPGLASLDVTESLPDPQLTVQPQGLPAIASNDDWGLASDADAIRAAAELVGAFELSEGSKDACLLLTLPAGVYTAHASDTLGRSGNMLVEVYALP